MSTVTVSPETEEFEHEGRYYGLSVVPWLNKRGRGHRWKLEDLTGMLAWQKAGNKLPFPHAPTEIPCEVKRSGGKLTLTFQPLT